jgi:molybdate transport system permease protein
MPTELPTDLSPLWLSLQVACLATALMLPFGLLAAWWLGQGRWFRGKSLIETLFTLPLVLPPTVVGYGLLLLLGRGTSFGRWLNDSAGLRLLFTWEGAAIAAGLMAFPLFVRTATAAFASVDRELLEAGRTLGASEYALWRRVTIPLAYRGLLAALSLAFARALGEFGATLMVAGSIPGRTQTLPLALYASVQEGRDHASRLYTLLLCVMAIVLLGTLGAWQGQISRKRGER